MTTRVEIRSDSSCPIPAGLEYPNFPDGQDPLPHLVDGVFSIPIEAARERRNVVLEQSLGIYEETDNERFRESVALGFGAVLSGLSNAEIAQLRGRLGSNRNAFDRAVESARNFRREHPERFAEAQRLYREQLMAWQDGVAAALLGEQAPAGGSEMTRHGHRAITSAASRGDSWVGAARAQAAAARSGGFIDRGRGHVNEHLRETDGAYRRGIEEARALRARSGASAVERRVRELEMERRPTTPVRG